MPRSIPTTAICCIDAILSLAAFRNGLPAIERAGHSINFPDLVTAAIPSTARDKPIELWWQEARVGQQGSLTHVWGERGRRPPALRDQRHDWACLFGAVCPERRVGAALVLPRADAQMMNLHLQAISRQVAPQAHAVLILDGAGRHRTGGQLQVPTNISLLHLPAYSPELNPVENIWQFLRQNFLANQVFIDYHAILDAGCEAWNGLMAMPKRIRSITARNYARTVTA